MNAMKKMVWPNVLLLSDFVAYNGPSLGYAVLVAGKGRLVNICRLGKGACGGHTVQPICKAARCSDVGGQHGDTVEIGAPAEH